MPDKYQYARLYETTGWNASYKLNVDELIGAVSRSWYLIGAYDHDALVGFYRKFGFQERPIDAPGMQIRRKI
jgi:hypothetical protein